MATFDLARFRDIAFGGSAVPDHPMGSIEEARKLLALLTEDDPAHGLADLTHWTATMNAADAFTPGRRGRILLMMHEAARPLWRALGEQYLAPTGHPTEGVEGDRTILQAMSDSAAEFSNGFALALDTEDKPSKWVKEHYAALSTRSLRWLSRRLALAYMMQSPITAALWERLHRRHALTSTHEVSRKVLPVYEGSRYSTSARIEYARALLLELANPHAIGPRDIELVYRIAGRVANAVQIATDASEETHFAVEPKGNARPNLKGRLEGKAAPLLYIGTSNCLLRLQEALERDAEGKSGDEDTLFGRGFALGERRRMLARVIEHWGVNPPRRRVQRVGMAANARVIAGFDGVLTVLPIPSNASADTHNSSRRELERALDNTSKLQKRPRSRPPRVGAARIIDASAGGLGLAIPSANAGWATHGALLAVLIEPGKDWFLGVLRRIFPIDDELRLGIQILAAKPCAVTLQLVAAQGLHLWEEETRREDTFDERHRRGILLERQALPLASATMLLPSGLAAEGSRFKLATPLGEQTIRVARVLDGNTHFQRVMFEPLGGAR